MGISELGRRPGRATHPVSVPGKDVDRVRSAWSGAVPWIKAVAVVVFAVGGIVAGQWLLFRRHPVGRLERPIQLASSPYVTAGAFAPDGRSLTVITTDSTLRRLSVPDLEDTSDTPLSSGLQLRGARFCARGAVFIPDWAPTPDALWRLQHPVTPPLRWLEDVLYHDRRAELPTLCDAATGRPLGTLQQGADLARLDVSPDGIYLAGIQRDPGESAEKGGHVIRVWDQRGRLKGTFHSQEPVVAVAISPTDPVMAWLHPKRQGMQVDFRNLSTGKPIQTLDAGMARGALLRYSPDGTRLAVGSKTMELWDWKWERRLLAYVARPPLDDVVFSRDRKRLLLVTTEMAGVHSWRILDIGAGVPGAPIRGTWLSPDWKTVADLSDGCVELRDARTGRLLAAQSPRREEAALGFSQNGGRFATAEDPGRVRVWDLASGKPMRTVPGPRGRILGLSADWTMAISRSGPSFVLWSFPSGQVLRRFSPPNPKGWDFTQLTPGPRQLLFSRRTFDAPATALTYDPQDGDLVQVLEPWTTEALDNAVCETAGDLVAGSTGEEWQAYSDKDRQQLWRRAAPERAVRIVADDKGKSFYFVGRTRVYVVTPATGAVTASFAHDGVPGKPNARLAALTPDGSLLATAESRATCDIAVWRPDTGERVATLRGGTTPARDLAFSPDGKALVSVGEDGRLLLWRLTLPAQKK